MKILITGSNGLLGQKLVDLLSVNKVVEVIATARHKNRLPEHWKDYTFAEMDITDPTQTDEVIARYQPDCIIHGAAMTQVDDCELNQEECWKQNVTAVEYLIHAAQGISAHFIYVSTDFVFDGQKGPLDESAVPNPINYYGKSKQEAERLVQQSGLDYAIIRTVLVYGITHDMSRSNIVLWVKDSLESGKSIQVVNDQWRTPTLAEDLAMGCYLAAHHKACGIYHISSDEMLTPYDIAIKTAHFFQLDASLINKTDGSRFTQPAKRPPKTGFIIKKARKDLGFTPHTFNEGLALMAKQME